MVATPGTAITLAADTGMSVDPADLSGEEAMEARRASLEQGRPLADDTPHTYIGYRAEADSWAELWNPDAKLYQVELLVSYRQRKFALQGAQFRYFGPSAETAEILVDRGGVKIASLANPVGAGAFFPREVPADATSAEEAMSQLWAMKLGVPAEKLILVLFHSGVTEPKYPIMQDLSQLPIEPEHANRWLWRTSAMRDELIVTSGFRGRRLVETLVYVPAEPAKPEGKPTVDPQAVGIWEMTVPTDSGGAHDWYFRIDADGTYAFAPSSAGSAPVHSGTIEIAHGRWSLKSETSDWTDSGTYELPTPDTLSMVGRLGPGEWQRRTPTAAQTE